MQLPSFVSTAIGWLAYEFARLQPFIPMYIHLIASAVFPIYAGAHSSLSRPSSAAKRKRAKEENKKNSEEEQDETDEDDESQHMEGLSPSDAILFPILAGCTLAGLYFLLKWLQDPSILNKILNWYFATFSVFAVSRLVSDGLDVFHSLLFPREYVDQGILYRVRPKVKLATPNSQAYPRDSPLPSILSRLPLSKALKDLLWVLHILPSRRVQFKGYIRHILDLRVKLGLHGLLGLIAGLTTVVWYNFVSKPWFLTNVMGFGFAYGTLQILSPTTFSTGSLILGGLFFYDIYFVFFTPMMVTVAKSLDVPIKLLFPRPAEPESDPSLPSLSMLGLGDIVLPGIMIGLALRFDLFMFYLKKQTFVDQPASASPRTRSASRKAALKDSTSKSANSIPAEASSTIKAPYVSVAQAWGDRLWTYSMSSGILGWIFAVPNRIVPSYVARNAFPKPYFHAGLRGYIIGMITTLIAMQVSDHAQPALLYLVPCVVASLWGTAWFRGELKNMWAFDDTVEDEDKEEDSKSEVIKSKEKGEQNQKTEASNDIDTNNTEVKSEGSADSVAEASGKEEPVAERTRSNQRKSIFSRERSDVRVKRLENTVSKSAKGNDGDDSEGDSKSRSGQWFSFKIEFPSLWPEGRRSQPKEQRKHDVLGSNEDRPRYSLKNMAKDEQAHKRQRVS